MTSIDIEKQPRIAVLGCGAWGRNIVRTVNKLGALAAVADVSEAGRASVAELAPSADIFSDPDPIFQDDTISGVMIATPAQTHYDMARRAIDAGKDVFVEKPASHNILEGKTAVAAGR